MAHYAFIDENSVVTRVIVGRDEDDNTGGVSDWEEYYSNSMSQACKRCSYNTREGAHIYGGTPFRGNFPDKGDVYDPVLDAFYKPQPYPSWTLNETTFQWEAPIPEPAAGGPWEWQEDTQEWVEMILFNY